MNPLWFSFQFFNGASPQADANYDVTVSGIPSAEAAGTPTVTSTNIVSPVGIPSGEVFGTGVSVDDAFTIAPGSITEGSVGTPTVTFSTAQTVNPASIAEGAVGNPVVSSDAVTATRKPGGGRVRVSYDDADRRPEFTLRAVSLDGVPTEEDVPAPGFSFVPEVKYPVAVSVPVVEPEPVLEQVTAEAIAPEETIAEPVFGFTWVASAGTVGDGSAVGEIDRTRSLTIDEIRKIKARNAAIIAALVAA